MATKKKDMAEDIEGDTPVADDDEALDELRLNGDFDRYKRCGPPSVVGTGRSVTMCETRQPPFLLDGLRLYTIGTLGKDLTPNDRLKLLEVETSSSCK